MAPATNPPFLWSENKLVTYFIFTLIFFTWLVTLAISVLFVLHLRFLQYKGRKIVIGEELVKEHYKI